MPRISTDKCYITKLNTAGIRRSPYKSGSTKIIGNPDEIRHDEGLYALWEHISNGGAKISNSEGNDILQAEVPKAKMNYFFIFDNSAQSQEDVNTKSSLRINGEGDICGVSRNGRPFIIEVKYKSRLPDAFSQVGRLRYFLSNPHYWPQTKGDYYKKFFSFLVDVMQSGTDPWESQLFYHSIKGGEFIDITKEAPEFDPSWFKKTEHLKKHTGIFIRDYKRFQKIRMKSQK
ncbi:MAG: hypothetical protein JW716_05530 [Candidatus Aenigmarchaeota archaeon]|nr:hypothetical protein [Candidatus Aenigmarchaeota archaeon]